MSRALDPPLVAKSDAVLQILAICRISTVNQDEKSLGDQEASYRAWLDGSTDTPYELRVISSRGSGESLDSPAYLEAISQVESGQFDLVIVEDLGGFAVEHTLICFAKCAWTRIRD